MKSEVMDQIVVNGVVFCAGFELKILSEIAARGNPVTICNESKDTANVLRDDISHNALRPVSCGRSSTLSGKVGIAQRSEIVPNKYSEPSSNKYDTTSSVICPSANTTTKKPSSLNRSQNLRNDFASGKALENVPPRESSTRNQSFPSLEKHDNPNQKLRKMPICATMASFLHGPSTNRDGDYYASRTNDTSINNSSNNNKSSSSSSSSSSSIVNKYSTATMNQIISNTSNVSNPHSSSSNLTSYPLLDPLVTRIMRPHQLEAAVFLLGLLMGKTTVDSVGGAEVGDDIDAGGGNEGGGGGGGGGGKEREMGVCREGEKKWDRGDVMKETCNAEQVNSIPITGAILADGMGTGKVSILSPPLSLLLFPSLSPTLPLYLSLSLPVSLF